MRKKFQEPGAKFQENSKAGNFKFQAPRVKAPFGIFRSLALGIYLEFGMWNLEFFPR